MEFLYRAGNERRNRSPSPPTPASSPPGSSAGGQPAAGADTDETRRQAEKARIREGILREETVDRFELELEVRLDLVERFRQISALNAGGPAPPAVPPSATVIQNNSSLPVHAPKVKSTAGEQLALLAKRRSPVHGAESNASVETSSKKQKLGLTCTVCGITANSEKAMRDHLNGKGHMRKAEALPAQPATEPDADEEAEQDDALFAAPSGDFEPTKFTMVTNKGAQNQVTQMDGYLLCEVCNVRTADRVTMMCHLEGTKHVSKAKKPSHATGEAVAGTPLKKRSNELAAPAVPVVASACAGDHPDTVVLEVNGEAHTVPRERGILLCERCHVKTSSEKGMRLHLCGKKHRNKTKASSVPSVNGANDVANGKEADKPQVADKGVAAVDETASKTEASLAKPTQENDSGHRTDELQSNAMATSANRDVVTMESCKAAGKEAAKVRTSPLATVLNAVGDSDLAMEVDGMRHPLRRVEGFLLCPCCDVKAPSDIVMRSHLAGKKHKNKMTSTATTAEAKNTSGASAAGAVAPIALDVPAEVISVFTPTEPSGGTAKSAGKPFKIQVEGKLFTVLQENDRFLCEACGVCGCNKDAIVKHLYTNTHWEKASLTEREEQLARAAAEERVKAGNGGCLTGGGMA